MKSFKLEKSIEEIIVNTKDGIKPVNFDIKTIDLLKTAINNPSKNGYSINDMRSRIKLLDIVEKAEKENVEEISLEDADFKILSDLVKETKWNVLSKSIIGFHDIFDKS